MEQSGFFDLDGYTLIDREQAISLLATIILEMVEESLPMEGSSGEGQPELPFS